MRLKDSTYNVTLNMVTLIVTVALTFITRTFFIKYLGNQMLGLDGLFTNVISMLSLTEMGFTAAISFSLYKPLAENDKKRISAIITLLKKIYFAVSALIFVIGICLIPLLPYFTKDYTGNNLILIYILYIVNCVLEYMIIYKTTLIIADQKEYKLFFIRTATVIAMYLIQIWVLIAFKSFVLYLITSIVVKTIGNIASNIYVTRYYKDIDFNSKDKIDNKTKKEITSNVKNLMIGNIGHYLINGTDNIILSAISIKYTGIYSNYLSLTGVMRTFMNTIYNGVIASFGNLVAVEDKETQERVFDISNFVCFLTSGFITLELIFLLNPFINIWIGQEYVVSFVTATIISLNFYFYSQKLALDTIKKAAGIYRIDKFLPMIQAAINLIVSIVLGRILGLLGVVIGTLVSYLTIIVIWMPYLLYKYLFNRNPFKYYIRQIIYFGVMFAVAFINYQIFRKIDLDTSILTLVLKAIIIMLVFLLSVVVLFNRTYEYQYIVDLIKQFLINMKNKILKTNQ